MADETPTPAAYHRYLSDAQGDRIAFTRVTTEPCPTCPPIGPLAFLGVTWTSSDRRIETVMCLNCEHCETRPRKRPPGARMNQPDPE